MRVHSYINNLVPHPPPVLPRPSPLWDESDSTVAAVQPLKTESGFVEEVQPLKPETGIVNWVTQSQIHYVPLVQDENSRAEDTQFPKIKSESSELVLQDRPIFAPLLQDQNSFTVPNAASPKRKAEFTDFVPRKHRIAIGSCLNGCSTSFDFGDIVHYYRGEEEFASCPFRPDFPRYDTLPAADSCKVVILRGGVFYDVMVKNHWPREWLPCWVVSPASVLIICRMALLILCAQITTTPSASQPHLYVAGNLQRKKPQIAIKATGGTDRTSRWEPGSAIVVEQYPRIIPKRFLHRIQEGKHVCLNKRSRTKLKVVFAHREEIRSDDDVLECLKTAKYDED